MSLELIFPLLGLAVVDSINPSALVIAAIILAKSNPDSRLMNLLAYILGIFVTYFILGLLILAGLDALTATVRDIMTSRTALVIQAAIGVLLLVYAILAPSKPNAETQKSRDAFFQRTLRPKLLFGYGMYVTALELVTALPYFAALALIANAKLPLAIATSALVVYCLIFVTPPLVIAYVYYRKRARFDAWLKLRSAKGSHAGRQAILWLVGIVGWYVLVQALFDLGVINLPSR